MRFEIKKILLKELEAFSKSADYQNSEVITISLNRIASYLNNPRADAEDVVLYLAYLEEKLVGFRTIFADSISINQQEYKFGWFSGNWVHVGYRRKGISTLLLNEVLKDWGTKLLYTNYAPNSKQLYDKSNKFDLFLEKQGLRFYFNMQLEELLTPRNAFFKRIRFLLSMADSLTNFILNPLGKINKLRFEKWLNPIILEDCLSKKQTAYLLKNNNSIFKRGETEYNWIFNYPWITTKSDDNRHYPFSSKADKFYYKFLSIESRTNEISALSIIKFRDGKVTTPYFCADNGLAKPLSMAIIAYCHKEKATLLTCYNNEFINGLKNQPGISLFRKSMSQKYFITKEFKNTIPLNDKPISVFDGDGDCIFT